MVSLKSRIEHFTWANFAYTIAGGGTASMLKKVPLRFKGLTAIGDIIFLYNLSVFAVMHVCIIARFLMFPGTLRSSVTHRAESQFVSTYLLTWATILMDIEEYAQGHTGAWRTRMLEILFWLYVAVCLIQGILQYAYIYISHKVKFDEFGPGMLLIIFPSMLSGCIAATFVKTQPRNAAIPMIVCGITLQMLGFNVSFLLYATIFIKFMTRGLPPPSVRPGMFIMVGPMAFTGLCMLLMGRESVHLFPPGFVSTSADSGPIFAMIGFYQALVCWGTCIWMFLVAAVTVLYGAIKHEMRFRLPWCAIVFPAAGMTTLTMQLGVVLDCKQLQWVGTIVAAVVSSAYLFCTCCYYWAIWKKIIIYPGNDEDAVPDRCDQIQTPFDDRSLASLNQSTTVEKVFNHNNPMPAEQP